MIREAGAFQEVETIIIHGNSFPSPHKNTRKALTMVKCSGIRKESTECVYVQYIGYVKHVEHVEFFLTLSRRLYSTN